MGAAERIEIAFACCPACGHMVPESAFRRRGPDDDDVDAARILDAVARRMGVAGHEIIGKDRSKHVTRARHVAAYVLRKTLVMSYPRIGRTIGRRDHTSAISAVRRVAADPQLRAIGECLAEDLTPEALRVPPRAKVVGPRAGGTTSKVSEDEVSDDEVSEGEAGR